MKIVYLHQYFADLTMSTGTRSYEIARRLVRWGHEVHMVTTSRDEGQKQTDGWKDEVVEGIHIHKTYVPYSNHMNYSERIRAFIQFAWASSAKAASLKGDVVFASSTPLTIAIPAIFASRVNRIPFVFEVRDLWPEVPIAMGALRNPLLRWAALLLEKVAYRAAEHIVALSPGMADGVKKQGIAPERVSIVPNSSDNELFDLPEGSGDPIRARLGINAEQPLIIYTGTFGRINGVKYLVDVAASIRDICPDCRFLLVGDGVEHSDVMDHSRNTNVLDKNLFVWKSIPKSDIPQVFSAATVVTSVVLPIPCLWNNSANKFFDALAAGKPIAINHQGWQADILNETGAGIVLSYDSNEAARQLAEFVSDRTRLKEAGQASRHLARTRFDREEMVRKLETILVNAVRKSQR